MKLPARPLLSAALLLALAACGGGLSVSFGDGHDDVFAEPRPSGRSASVQVTAASDASLEGTYASANLLVGSVLRFSEAGPDFCEFRFDGLQGQPPAGARVMRGNVRYQVGTGEVLATVIFIGEVRYRAEGGAVLRRGENAIEYTGATFRTGGSAGARLTLSGTIPMRNEGKPHGC